MSVYGGDSWAREAQNRKRRVDDLLIEGINASAYKKLPNGKFSCLVCPQRPVLDTPLMLSVSSFSLFVRNNVLLAFRPELIIGEKYEKKKCK